MFFSFHLIVLPKLNDLFLELKEMQCREKGTDKAQGREGGSQRRRRETGDAVCVHLPLSKHIKSRGRSFPPPGSRWVRH